MKFYLKLLIYNFISFNNFYFLILKIKKLTHNLLLVYKLANEKKSIFFKLINYKKNKKYKFEK